MANRTIKTIDGTEHSGNRSAFTDYDNYVEYKNRLTQTKIYNSMIIFDSVTMTLTDIALKIAWLISLLMTSFLLSSWVIIPNEGEDKHRAEVISSPLPPEKHENLGSSSIEGEDNSRADSTPSLLPPKKPEDLGSSSIEGEDNSCADSTPKILPPEKPKDLGSPCKGQPKFRLKSTPRILRRDPVENAGDVITPNPSIYPLFERELQSLLDQAFIDPFSQYILQYQGDKNRAWFVQQAKTEREKRCANIEQNFQRRPKNCATLAWLKRGYNYSCPQVVVKFVENISCS